MASAWHVQRIMSLECIFSCILPRVMLGSWRLDQYSASMSSAHALHKTADPSLFNGVNADYHEDSTNREVDPEAMAFSVVQVSN